MSARVIVQKFGGSSVADAGRLKQVAGFIASCLHDDLKIVVVVSAMGQATNELIKLAHDVCADPPKRELDMLTSCGERSSMALLAMALSDIGIRALSLTGSQSGIITDDNHSGAEIIAIKPARVREALKSHQVVIIAGFQGVSEKKEITTLRRGGSDTTAVAMAAALEASVCEIYTDVPGVMDSDPRIVASATILPTVTFGQMETMALYGARVLAHDAIRLAKAFNVSLRIAKTGEQYGGTAIDSVSLKSDHEQKIALTHLRALLRIRLSLLEFEAMKRDACYFLCGYVRDDTVVAYFSNDISQEFVAKRSRVDAGIALITVHVGKNQMTFAILPRLGKLLQQHGIAYDDLIISGTEIFVLVKDDDLNRALSTIHDGLKQMETNQ